jgi:hypothetical protein
MEVGAGELELTTTSNSGTTLLIADVPTGDVYTLNLPEDGILFPQGIFLKQKQMLLHILCLQMFIMHLG